MIKTKKLSSQRSVTYGFFGSKGGVSKGIYKSLNCGVGSNDKKNNIKKNLNIVLKKLKSNTKKIHLPKQIHSNKFYFIKNKSIKSRFKCDALITKQINTPIGVLTADCAPIVLFDPNKEIISVIHAGWRGALSGIVRNVTNFFIKEGSKVESLEIIIGPCISQNSYEVKDDFLKKFLKKDKKNKIFFKSKNKKYFFNLKQYIILEMKKLGIKKIQLINKDTFSGVNTYFSARRSLKKKENDYGRNLSLIMIN